MTSISDIPIVPSPDNIHLFVIGGTAGRFSSFIPGWGHYNNPGAALDRRRVPNGGPVCIDGTCYL